MRRRWPAAVLLAVVSHTSAHAGEPGAAYWPSFRGPRAGGIAEGHATPTTWGADDDRHIRWKTPIEGLGHSSPVIWGDRIFVTSAISGEAEPTLKVGLYGDIAPVDEPTEHAWRVYCVDRSTGRILWHKTVHRGVPRIRRHPKASHANATPATDGTHVVTFFGAEGLYCHDMKGDLLWRMDLGALDSGFFRAPRAQWGFGSSPVIHDGVVVVQCDVQKGSFIAAFDVRDGARLWRRPRDEVPTWCTPTIHGDGARPSVIVNGYRHIGAYDLASGDELWRLSGGGDIPVPTPVVADGLVYITSAHGPRAPIYAIRPDAEGDITTARAGDRGPIVWSVSRGGAYMQTPLVYGGHLYCCQDNGVLSCYEARTGKRLNRIRLGRGRKGFTASGVAADGKLYYTSEVGNVHVVEAGPELKVLAVNSMDEICMATPAIAQGVIYFRTRRHLVAVGEP